jgi:putative PEP-CTERM system histidine kinase
VTAIPFAAALASLLLAAGSAMRPQGSLATWCFSAGMFTLGVDSLCTGLALGALTPGDTAYWLGLALSVKSLAPVVWLSFSLTYSRGVYRQFLAGWRVPLGVLSVLPLVAVINGPAALVDVVAVDAQAATWTIQFSPVARILSAAVVVSFVLVLSNIEQTFRATVGTMRWRIKFVIVALVVMFGTTIYVRSQAILFSAQDPGVLNLESLALIIGGAFLAVAYLRTGWTEIDVYPSRAVLQSSITLLVAGGYLLTIGVGAQLVRVFGGAEYFQLQAVVVLVGLSGLAILLLSDRFRGRVRTFAVRHFQKAQHDSVRLWSSLSQRLATAQDRSSLSIAAVRLISESFEAMSVTMWLKQGDALFPVASTAQKGSEASLEQQVEMTGALQDALATKPAPFDFEDVQEAWAETLRKLNVSTFSTGGHRWCVPLRAGSRVLGALVLGDRVNGTEYTVEERVLLACIADHLTSLLLNQQLADEVAQARELEAFRTMSAFFVHDLKNAAASLHLTLKNLPVHFEDPAFRADALRVVGNTARRIDDLITRLGTLRQRSESRPAAADLNALVTEAVERLGDMPNVEVTAALQPLPQVLANRDQIQSVVSNLVLNARDAVGAGGHVHLRTEHERGRVVLSVTDDGCGMSPAFLRDSLFRPFQSTKPKGLGIGLFQSRAIVQAHGGSVRVDSTPGRGTTFQVILPVMEEQ